MNACPHANPARSGFHCGFHGRHVSAGKCRHCGGKPKPMAGLGDVIATVTSAVGITPCAKCKKRQAKLNAAFPIR